MGRFDSLTQLEQKPEHAPPLPQHEEAKVSEQQFASKPAKKQTN